MRAQTIVLFCAALCLPSNAFAAPLRKGDLVGRSFILRDLPADSRHRIERKLLEQSEQEISCLPRNKTLLIVHHRAVPRVGPADDRIAVSVKVGSKYRILENTRI
jgi:hypothetical protein